MRQSTDSSGIVPKRYWRFGRLTLVMAYLLGVSSFCGCTKDEKTYQVMPPKPTRELKFSLTIGQLFETKIGEVYYSISLLGINDQRDCANPPGTGGLRATFRISRSAPGGGEVLGELLFPFCGNQTYSSVDELFNKQVTTGAWTGAFDSQIGFFDAIPRLQYSSPKYPVEQYKLTFVLRYP